MPRLRLSVPAWNRLVVAVWLGGIALVRAGSPEERDAYWQARAGLEQLAGTPVARPDAWSWAPVEGLFYPNSPGWNVLLGLAWRAAGYWGLFWLTALTIGGFLALAYALARWLGARPLPALAGIVGVAFLTWPMLNARATVAVQILLLLALALPAWWQRPLTAAGAAWGGAASFAAGAVVSGLGNWLHLSWLTWTPLVAGAWLLHWLLLAPRLPGSPSPARRAALGASGIAGLLAGLAATPYGVAGGVERTLATQRAAQGLFTEWLSPFATGSPRWMAAALMLVGLGCVLVHWLADRWRCRPLTTEAALVAGLAMAGLPSIIGGLVAIRFVGAAALVLAPVAGWAATGLVDRFRRAVAAAPATTGLAGFGRRWTVGHPWRVVLTSVAVLLLPGVLLLGPGRHARPPEAAAVAGLPTGCRLMAPDDIAAVAILTRPDVLVWVDSRIDYYGRERFMLAREYLRGNGATAVPPGTTCVVLPPRDAEVGMRARLAAEPGWESATNLGGFEVWVDR